MPSAETDGASREFVRFPPRWRNVLVPLAPARASALGVTLYSASRPLPWTAQNILWALARAGGGRLLPGERTSWSTPLDPVVAAALEREWTGLIGRTPDGIAVYERTQAARAALTLLVCAQSDSMLVRIRRDTTSLLREQQVSEFARVHPLRTFCVPEFAGRGEAGGWYWTAFRVMGTRPHRPVYRLPRGATEEIATLVEAVVPRPPGTPTGWVGGHLDVSPWNLRRAGGTTWLIDWEDAGWAPPCADEVYLAAVVGAMRGGKLRRSPVVDASPEAANYWATIVADRVINPNETRLRTRMLEMLQGS